MEFLTFYKGAYRKCHSSTTRMAFMDLKFTFAPVFLFIWLSMGVNGKLTLTKQCGEIVCKPHYYCARIDDSCRPCQETCDRALSNYDQDLCEKDCQDYLHDLFYMRKSLQNQSEYDEEKFRVYYTGVLEDLWTLKISVFVLMIICTGIMLILLGFFVYTKRPRNRLGISNPLWCGGKKDDIMDLPVIYSNSKCVTLPSTKASAAAIESVPNLRNSRNNNLSRVSTPDVVSRSDISVPVSVLSIKKLPLEEPVKRPQKLRREPSESTLPEYHGYVYDNPALAPSPTHM